MDCSSYGSRGVVARGGEWRSVEAEGSGRSRIGSNESRGGSVGVCRASSAGSVVFGNDLRDGGIEIGEEVVLEVARDPGELCVVVLRVMNDLV